MDTGNKKIVILAVLAFAAAGLIFFFTQSDSDQGIESIGKEEQITLMCRNSQCGHVYEMNKREYYSLIEEVRRPEQFNWPRIECPECGQKSIDRAVRCQGCDKVFFLYSVLNDYPDRCPYCGYSESEN